MKSDVSLPYQRILLLVVLGIFVVIIIFAVGIIDIGVASLIASLIIALFTAIYATAVFLSINQHTKDWELSVRPLVTYDVVEKNQKNILIEEKGKINFEIDMILKNHSSHLALDVIYLSFIVINRYSKNSNNETEEQSSIIEIENILDGKEKINVNSHIILNIERTGYVSADEIEINSIAMYRSMANVWYKVHIKYTFPYLDLLEGRDSYYLSSTLMFFHEIGEKDVIKEWKSTDGKRFRATRPSITELFNKMEKNDF